MPLRKAVTMVMLAVSALAASSQDNIVQKVLNGMLQDKDLKNATIGFYCTKVGSDSVVAQLNPQTSMVPASVLKLVTTATALELLGPDRQFGTTVEYTGTIDSTGVLHGDIYIRGGGDPALGSSRFPGHYYAPHFMEQWIDSLQALGIDSIDGRVIADARIFSYAAVPVTWIWADIGQYYGAAPSGLSIYENTYELEFRSGFSDGDPTWLKRIDPELPGVTFVNEVKSSNRESDNAFIYGEPYGQKRVIRGTIPKARPSFVVKGALPDPPLLAVQHFDLKLREAGIGISGEATTVRTLLNAGKKPEEQRQPVATTWSPHLADIIEQTNMHSINLYAEHLLDHLALENGGIGHADYGTETVKSWWFRQGIDMEGFYMNDGSGLSRANAVTAEQLVGVLDRMAASPHAVLFEKSLPVAGESGSLRSLCNGTRAEGNLRAKSGYMTRARSYAGYVTTRSGEKLAFAFMVNNYNCSAQQMKSKMEKVLVALAEVK